jgi:DNA-directed RNA polymerase subunit RPC12/RpoP
MAQENTLSPRLWTAIDGYDVDRGFGRTCSSCTQEYEPGDRLLVIAERPSNTTGWTVSSIVCTDCGQQRLSKDQRQASVDQVLASAELAMVGMTLALDGESARLLDRSPANEA